MGVTKSRKTDSHPLFVYIAKAPSLQAANRWRNSVHFVRSGAQNRLFLYGAGIRCMKPPFFCTEGVFR